MPPGNQAGLCVAPIPPKPTSAFTRHGERGNFQLVSNKRFAGTHGYLATTHLPLWPLDNCQQSGKAARKTERETRQSEELRPETVIEPSPTNARQHHRETDGRDPSHPFDRVSEGRTLILGWVHDEIACAWQQFGARVRTAIPLRFRNVIEHVSHFN